MPAVDWMGLLRRYNVEYVLVGPNVARGNINISCPFCGEDPSHHMGINLKSGYWGCWRNTAHRGKRPHRLLSKLLRMTPMQIEGLLGTPMGPEESIYELALDSMFTKPQDETAVRAVELAWPSEFKSIEPIGIARRYWDYLEHDRIIHHDDVPVFLKEYGMAHARVGDWAGRIIIPYFAAGRVLVTWTARSINKNEELRYRTCPAIKSVAKAPEILYNANHVPSWGLELPLLVVEGPFDAMKAEYYCGLPTVALSTKTISQSQIVELISVAEGRPAVVFWLDDDSTMSGAAMAQEVQPFLQCATGVYESPGKDAAALTPLELDDVGNGLRAHYQKR